MSELHTIVYGAWAPDLANVGVALSSWQSSVEVTLPVADCNGVYWEDGSYRCLPGLSPIGPSLGIPITNAVSWYDEASGKEIIFAATANGLSMLEDGAWSSVPIQSNAQVSAVGALIQLTLGTPTYFSSSLSITPTSQTLSGTPNSQTFGAEVVTASSGTPSSYVWSLQDIAGSGTWSIVSGQGTASCVAKVTGTNPSTTNRATLQCVVTIGGGTVTLDAPLIYNDTHTPPYSGTLTAGVYADESGDEWIGYSGGSPSWGSLAPTTDSTGKTIAELTYYSVGGVGTGVQLQLTGFASDPGSAYFTQLVAGSTTLTSAASTYNWEGSGTALWTWAGVTSPFVNGDVYSITIDYPP